jgi:hypothetical protein
MQPVLIAVVAAVTLLLFVRFIFVVRGDACFRNACSESAGWLLLASVVLGPAFAIVTYGSTDTDVAKQIFPETVERQNVVAAERVPEEPRVELQTTQPVVNADTIESAIPSEPVVAENDEPVEATVKAAREKQTPKAVEQPRDEKTRRQLLEKLHAETIEKFVKAPGFGYIRRIKIRIDEFKTPEKSRIYLARSAGKAATREIPLPDRSLWDKRKAELSALRELQRLTQQLKRAADSSPAEVAETEDEPDTEPVQVVEAEPQWDEWEVSDWELVSIMQHDPPVAYASSDLKMMHKPRAAATRPLDKLEKGALAKLRKGESLVIHNGVNAIRVLGSVLARAKCIKCHRDKKEGDLLGAFSYELHRLRPIALAAAIGE